MCRAMPAPTESIHFTHTRDVYQKNNTFKISRPRYLNCNAIKHRFTVESLTLKIILLQRKLQRQDPQSLSNPGLERYSNEIARQYPSVAPLV